VLVVRIEREAKRNAIDQETADAIGAAMDELDDDADLWAGVITGTRSVFCAGSDLGLSASARTERGGEYGLIRRERVKPLIAAVEGIAYGGGFEIALACDVIVASTSARFALPEVKRGVTASSGALFRITRALPRQISVEMLITGEPIDVQRAYDLGLIGHLVAEGTALERALELAEAICQNSPTSVQATLAGLRTLIRDDDAAGWAATAETVGRVVHSADRAEGIAAFHEKRPPRWVGR
jgi:enoyl-CoA hydratase/carnithine racemase